MIAALLAAALLAADGEAWKKVDTVDGVTVEVRPVKGARVNEHRFVWTSTAPVERLCEEAFGTGKFDPDEPSLRLRKVIEESADERLTYEQVAPPLISNRDCGVHSWRQRLEGGACRVIFEAANDRIPALPAGFVRIELLKGIWYFEPLEGGRTRATYAILTDPAGAVPPFLSEGPRRAYSVKWVKLLDRRAREPKRP